MGARGPSVGTTLLNPQGYRCLAATARANDQALTDIRLVFFGVGTTPVRARGAEAALANGDVEAAAKALAADLNPSDDVQASSAVKRQFAGVLIQRVARQLMGEEA